MPKLTRPGLSVLLTAALLAACNLPQAVRQVQTDTPSVRPEVADIIFHNGTVLTFEPNLPPDQGLAVRGEKILALGSDAQALSHRGPQTNVIDLQGRTLMPGFVDAHTHLFNDAGSMGSDLDGIQQLALEDGITTLGDMYVTSDFLAQMRQLQAGGRLRVRTSLYLLYNTNCGEVVGDWWKDVAPTRVPGEMLRIGGVKIFADGGSCKRPALSYETSPGSGYGDLFLSGARIEAVVREAQALGHQVAVHALGDRAVEAALDGIGGALDGAPNTHRHRIEHNAVIRPELLPRYGQIGIVATIFASYPVCNPLGKPSPPPYNQWEWAWPALLQANPGLHVAWHGDDPYIKPVSPILELYGFVTRNQALDDRTTVCESPEWIRDDTLTAAQALPMMTRESAYALFRDDEVGTLRPGKYADLIVLSNDPSQATPDELLQTQVLLTMVGGKIEFCARPNGPLCP